MPDLTPDAQPDLSSLLRGAGAQVLRRLRVAIPAMVVSFDSNKATVACQPLIDEPQAEGGHLADPSLDAVPVLYPGSAHHAMRWPLVKGDTVLLVFLDRASDGWALGLLQAENAKVQQPAERRWHHYSDAVAIPISTRSPSLRPVGTFLEVVGSEVRVHADGGTAIPLATKADIDAFKTVFDAHLHVVSVPITGPAGTTVAAVAPPASPFPPPAGTSVLKGQ